MTLDLGDNLAEQAVQWIGVKYEHRGTTRYGCDCTGLIIGCLRELGYMGRYKLRNYPFDWNLHAGAGDYLCQELDKIATDVTGQQPEPGDIAVFRFGKCRAHAGIVCNWPIFVHSLVTREQCCRASAHGPLWKRRLDRLYRLDIRKLGRYD